MTTDPRLDDLLVDWEDAHKAGQPVTAEELCRDCPELLDEVRRRIQAMEAMRQVLGTPDARKGRAEERTAQILDSTRDMGEHVQSIELPPTPNVPGFAIQGTLGRGGMGVVYKAMQRGLDRLVALKMVLAGQHATSQERARFDSEARLIARLNHPNIVQIYALGEYDGMPYFVMEYMEGGSLDNALAGQPLPASQAAALLKPLALALQHAHQQGIIHRDLKSANILLRAVRLLPGGELDLDTPKICDFGLARHLEQERLTRPGGVVGTPSYMAPEQAVAEGNIGPWTDVYSLGVVLYEMLTGRVPFSSGTEWQIMQAVVNLEPVPPSSLRLDLPKPLEAICLRCLRKEPTERYASAEALADDLGRFLDGKPLEAEGGSNRSAGVGLSRRRLLIGTAVAVPAAAAVWYGAATGWFGMRPSGPPIKIGLLHPTSGALALNGPSMVDSEQAAIEDINRQGGLMGRPVVGVAGDSDSSPDGMAREAERLIEKEGVAVLVGGWTSLDRKTILAVVERHDHLLLYPVESEGLEESHHVAYLGALPNQLIVPVARWFVENRNKRRFFLVGLDTVYAHAVEAILHDELPALNGELCGSDFIPVEGGDVKKTALAIVGASADAIFNVIQGDYNTQFFRRLREAGISPRQVPAISFSLTEKELPTIDRKDMVGDYLAGSYFQTIDTPANRHYLKLLQAVGRQPVVTTDAMEAGYVAIHLWAQAVRAAGSADFKAVRKTLGGQSFDGPGGPTTLEAASFCSTKNIRLGQIRADGSIPVTWSSPGPIAPVPFPTTRTREEWEKFLNGLYRKWGNAWANPERK